MGASITKEDEKLVIDLYQSNNEDVDVIIAQLYTLQDKYIVARKRASIGAIAEKLEISRETVKRILERNEISRYECPSRVIITKKYVDKRVVAEFKEK